MWQLDSLSHWSDRYTGMTAKYLHSLIFKILNDLYIFSKYLDACVSPTTRSQLYYHAQNASVVADTPCTCGYPPVGVKVPEVNTPRGKTSRGVEAEGD